MKKEESVKIIKDTISTEKSHVIDALKKSKVFVTYNVSEDDLLKLILDELKSGNGYLVYHLGLVIDKKNETKSAFDFSLNPSALSAASQATSQSSPPTGGGIGNFLSQNSGLLTAGMGLLGNLLGGGNSNTSQQNNNSLNNSPTSSLQFQYAAQQAQLEAEKRAREEKMREESQKNKTNTILIVSGIVLSVGLITTITIFALKK